MSIEQPDPDLVEQTKNQIRNLVREIAQLSRSDMSPAEFYDAFLTRVVAALAAVGGAVWTIGDGGALQLDYQQQIRETGLAESQERQTQHAKLLRRVMNSGEGAIIPPHSGGADDEAGGNPTKFLLVLQPLRTDQQVAGIVEIFQRPDGNITVQRGYLRFLQQMGELASDYLKTRQLRNYSDRQTLWSQLEQFTKVTHRSLDPRLTAYTIANEGRRLIECDRLSVGIMKGRKCIIEAVSGQDTFDKRSNVIQLLNRLSTAVAATGEAIWYTGDTSFMAPQVEDAIQEYVDEAHSKAVGVIPLKAPQDTPEEEQDKDGKVVPVLACLIVEQIEDAKPKEGLFQRVQVVAEHSSTALTNALEHQNLFLMPLWRAIGKSKWIVSARTLPKTLLVLFALIGLAIAACVVPKTFELEGRGTLEPIDQQSVYAVLQGSMIDEVYVDHGQSVKAGDPLVQLKNNDLDGKIEDFNGKIKIAASKIGSLQGQIGEKGREPGQEKRIRGEINQAEKEQESAKKQLKIVLDEKEKLLLTSPLDGEIVTWDPKNLLAPGRPVQPGLTLLTVAELDGEWWLEIRMPEERIGHIREAQKLQKKEDLEVSYILATDPAHKLKGKIKEVQRIAEVHGEEGNTVLIRVAIERKDVEKFLHPGAGVIARVNCGTAPIGYVYLHDLISFIQTKILFRL
jgi:multidrug efflux pump subunit AcrA (membrane-fusion protein)